jgi:hypothetical protein
MPVSGLTSLISAYASVAPSGDQDEGNWTSPSRLSISGSSPPAGSTQYNAGRVTFCEELNAMCRPSGVQTGAWFTPRTCAGHRAVLSYTQIIQDLDCERRPSGDSFSSL